MLYEFGGYNLKGTRFARCGSAAPEGGFALGLARRLPGAGRAATTPSARGAKPLARLSARGHRPRQSPQAGRDRRALDGLCGDAHRRRDPAGTRGHFRRDAAPSRRPPRSARSSPSTRDLPVRATGTHLGHGFEPQFPMNIALAALAVQQRQAVRAVRTVGSRSSRRPRRSNRVVVTGVGHWRGEGLWRWSKRSAERRMRRTDGSWQQVARQGRPAHRRRHRHGHRHLARRRQGRELGEARRRANPASARSPAFRPTA